jgi:hypothetical protein
LLPLSIAVFCGEHADSFADLFLHPVCLVNDLLLFASIIVDHRLLRSVTGQETRLPGHRRSFTL